MADNQNVQAPLTQEAVSEQNEIRLNKLRELTEAGKNPYEITRFDRTHLSDEILSSFETLENETVTIAGRMMSRRVMGKASFAFLPDRNAGIQIYVRRDDIGEESYADFKKMDIGDILGVTGKVFKTKTG
ncbi:MAG: lysine--tRNA ligase, partial [Clostridia bacterium]|nr:lysine--tRNA ligase [Clostridia bacterium]